MLALDNGEYFNKNGTLNANLGIEYIKASSWELKPTRKGTAPVGFAVNGETFLNEIYSIDGEKYPA